VEPQLGVHIDSSDAELRFHLRCLP